MDKVRRYGEIDHLVLLIACLDANVSTFNEAKHRSESIVGRLQPGHEQQVITSNFRYKFISEVRK